jgi:hypothetical protein
MRKRYRCCRTFAEFTCLLLAAVALVPSYAKAKSINNLDFWGVPGGTVSYTAGVGNTFSLLDEPISKVEGNSHSYLNIVDGEMSFQTSACESPCTTRYYPNQGFYGTSATFGKGGNLTIYGEIPSIGIDTETLLLDAYFNNPSDPSHTAVFTFFSTNSLHSGMNAHLIETEINPVLLQYFNIPDVPNGEGYMSQFLLNMAFTPPTWTGIPGQSDTLVDPTLVIDSSLAEPGTLILFGTSVLIAAYMLRRMVGSPQK